MEVFRRALFRRLFLLTAGLCLGILYHYHYLTDYYVEPFMFSLIIGFFSITLFRAFINYVIVLIGMVLAIVVTALSANLGAGEPVYLGIYFAIASEALVRSAVPLLVWIVGLPGGFYLRHLILDKIKKTRQN